MKQLVRRRILIIIFFIIATTASALHELTHIENHDSSSCQICVVDEHSVSADIVTDVASDICFSVESSSSQVKRSNPHAKKVANHSQAPPLVS